MMNEELKAIEERRRKASVPVCQLERLAALGVNYYRDLLAGRYRGSPAVMRRLERALDEWAGDGDKNEMVGAVVVNRPFLGLVSVLICEARGLDAVGLSGQKPGRRASGDAVWLQAAQVRHEAWALINNAYGVRAAEITRAAGVSRAAVSLALKRVEDRREEEAYDQMLARLEKAVSAGVW